MQEIQEKAARGEYDVEYGEDEYDLDMQHAKELLTCCMNTTSLIAKKFVVPADTNIKFKMTYRSPYLSTQFTICIKRHD